MAKKKIELSPAHVLVAHVWANVQEATGHSWQRLNSSMHSAVMLAIEAGLRFDETDIRAFYRDMRGGYWFGQGDGMGEGEQFFTRACKYGNDSAARSFEAWKGRSPFVLGGSRLSVGSDFVWFADGPRKAPLRVTVTSFTVEGTALTACSYKSGERKVARRLSITLEEIKTAEKARVAAGKDEREVKKICDGLKRDEIKVSAEQVGKWTKAQRTEVLAYIGRDTWVEPQPAVPAFLGKKR